MIYQIVQLLIMKVFVLNVVMNICYKKIQIQMNMYVYLTVIMVLLIFFYNEEKLFLIKNI